MRLEKLEIKQLKIDKFRKTYLKGEKDVEICDNKEFIAEMDASYPESDSQCIDRVITYTYDILDSLKKTDDTDAALVVSHWKVVEEFSEYHGDEYVPMDY